MPAPITYPGVYVEEIPGGGHPIPGVATSMTAFIGRADRGDIEVGISINSFADYEKKFGGLSLLSPMSFAVRDFYLNGGREAVIVRVHNGATTARITLPTEAGSPPSPNPPGDNLIVDAASPGAWGARLTAMVDYDTKDKDSPHPDQRLFNLTIQEVDPNTNRVLNTETFLNVSVNSTDERFVGSVLAKCSGLVRIPRDDPSAFIVPTGRPLETLTQGSSPGGLPCPGIQTPIKASASSDGSDVTEAQFDGPALQATKRGLFALEKTDLFNLLCIPPFSFTSDVTTALIGTAAKYCADRRAFLLVDSPRTWSTKKTALDQLTDTSNDFVGTRSNNAAIFFPRLQEANPLQGNQLEEFAPCGAVAGVFARTDSQRGVWKAPAGQEATLVGVLRLSIALTDDESGELNRLGVNCLRAFPSIGRVVWGSRTLEGADQLASQWKYIPVRRTALFIEESVYRGTKWVVFEPNDELLWAQIRLNVGAFMQSLFRQGAFQGSTPREAYFVKCDGDTMTQNDIDNGVVNIQVGFAPLKPAEFVVIKIQQLACQIKKQ